MNTQLIGFDTIHQLLKNADVKALDEVTRYLELTPVSDVKRMYDNIIDKLGVIYNEHDADTCFEVNENIKAIIEPPKVEGSPIFIEDDDIELDVPTLYQKVVDSEIRVQEV